MTDGESPLYLLAELRVADQELLLRYATEVQPLMRRFGGRIIAVSPPDRRVLEGDWPLDLIVLHRWETQEGFDEFWSSPEYQEIKTLRLQACDSRIVVFPGLRDGLLAGETGR